MIGEQRELLLKTIVHLQLCVYQVDELQEDVKLCFHDVKQLSKRLTETILTKHNDNIASLWKVEGGEDTVKMMMDIYEGISKELSTCTVSQAALYLELVRSAKSGDIRYEPNGIQQ
jgi:hypothetical protein